MFKKKWTCKNCQLLVNEWTSAGPGSIWYCKFCRNNPGPVAVEPSSYSHSMLPLKGQDFKCAHCGNTVQEIRMVRDKDHGMVDLCVDCFESGYLTWDTPRPEALELATKNRELEARVERKIEALEEMHRVKSQLCNEAARLAGDLRRSKAEKKELEDKVRELDPLNCSLSQGYDALQARVKKTESSHEFLVAANDDKRKLNRENRELREENARIKDVGSRVAKENMTLIASLNEEVARLRGDDSEFREIVDRGFRTSELHADITKTLDKLRDEQGRLKEGIPVEVETGVSLNSLIQWRCAVSVKDQENTRLREEARARETRTGTVVFCPRKPGKTHEILLQTVDSMNEELEREHATVARLTGVINGLNKACVGLASIAQVDKIQELEKRNQQLETQAWWCGRCTPGFCGKGPGAEVRVTYLKDLLAKREHTIAQLREARDVRVNRNAALEAKITSLESGATGTGSWRIQTGENFVHITRPGGFPEGSVKNEK